MLRVNGDGSREEMPADEEAIEAMAEVKAREKVGEIQLSRAQARLSARRQSAHRPQVIEISDGTDAWFLRALSLPLLHELSLRTSRDENGVLVIGDEAEYAQFLAAVLFVCLVSGKADLMPYFDRDDQGWATALEQANDPEMTETNSYLVNAALTLNPDILPEASAELERLKEEAEAELGEDADPLDGVPESLPSSNGNPENGSPETPSISPLSI